MNSSFKSICANPIHFLAFGFGSGCLKPASGTWGTLMGLLVFLPIYYFRPHPTFLVIFLICTFVIGCWICGRTAKDLGVHDFSGIVWDEMVAMWLILICLPTGLSASLGHSLTFALSFIVFRIFDIWKPYPISWFDDKFHNGFGIMFDDVLAGVYSLGVLYFIHYLILSVNYLWWIVALLFVISLIYTLIFKGKK